MRLNLSRAEALLFVASGAVVPKIIAFKKRSHPDVDTSVFHGISLNILTKSIR